MLDKTVLTDALKVAMYGCIDHNTAQTNLINTIHTHVKNNLEITGVYTGFLKNGSPDPAGGQVVYNVSDLWTMDPSNFFLPKDYLDWVSTLSTQLSKIDFKLINTTESTNKVFISKYKIPTITVEVDYVKINPKKEDVFSQAMKHMASTIIDGILHKDVKKEVLEAEPIKATSSNSGEGVVKWSDLN